MSLTWTRSITRVSNWALTRLGEPPVHIGIPSHPEWPFHLWLALEDDKVTSAGGPNLPMPGAGFVERAVARCPGNPVEVLRSDDRAEHVPGCNVAFKKEALVTAGGFDPVYTTAGDDVDISWKLLDRGHEIAFAPAAQVWHHRRGSVRAFLSQQVGYGRAERMVYRRHRHRFNRGGQARWVGFIYAYQPLLPRLLRPVVYHGALGLAPFQPVIRRPSVQVAGYASAYLPLAVPLAAAGAVLAAFHTWWLALSALACLFVVMYATAIAAGAPLSRSEPNPLAFRLLVAFLHVAQPLARTWGRIRGGPDDPLPARSVPAWTGDRFAWLMDLERELMARRCSVRASDSDAEWDLTVWVGPMIRCNVTTAVVWHWLPRCRLRFRPRAVGVLAVLATTALTLSGVGPGKLLLLMMLALPGVEAIVLSRIVRGALRCTTQGTAE